MSCKYHFDSISSFFVFAGIEPILFELPCLVFISCKYYFLKIVFNCFYVFNNFAFKDDICIAFIKV